METQQHHNDYAKSISMRCPECLKAYQVQASAIVDEKPTFQCQDCENLFWFPLNSALGKPEFIAFPMNWDEQDLDLIFYHDELEADAALSQHEGVGANTDEQISNTDSELNTKMVSDTDTKGHVQIKNSEQANSCPKCHFEYLGQQKECDSCGVIFEKFYKAQKDFDGAASEIQKLWNHVLEAYDQLNLHQDFIDACTKDKNLEFAAKKYRQVLEAIPSDDIAQAMQKQITALTTVIEGAQLADQLPRVHKKTSKFNVTLIILFISGLVIGTGYLIHPLRNLMGVGVAMIFLTLALRVYFKKNQ